MDEKAIKAEMRLYVIEGFVATLLMELCLRSAPHDPLAAFQKIEKQVTEGAKKTTFPGIEPTMSDLMAAELEDAVTRLAAMANAQIHVVLEARKGGSS